MEANKNKVEVNEEKEVGVRQKMELDVKKEKKEGDRGRKGER